MYFIAVLSGLGLQTALFLFYLYHSYRYRGITSEKLQYYITANIPLATATVYSLALVKYNNPQEVDAGFLNFFFIEWIIATPLFIINIGKVLHVKLYKYFLLSFATVAMNFCGYLAHNTSRPAAFGPFAAGGACYLFIVSFLFYIYRRRRLANNTGTEGCIRSIDAPITLCVAYRLLVALSCLWSLYPTVFLLNLFETLTVDITITLFVVLDIITKGFFTLLILGYYDYLYRRDTFLQFLVRPRQIQPAPPSPTSTPPLQSQPATTSLTSIQLQIVAPRIHQKMESPLPIVFSDI